MQILVSSGSTVRLVTAFRTLILNVKHSLFSVKESALIGIEMHWRAVSSSMVTCPLIDHFLMMQFHW
jgi:hypothetical protein